MENEIRSSVISENVPVTERKKICCSKDAADLLHDTLAGLDHEQTWALFLNNANVVTGIGHFCSGTIDACPIDKRRIVKTALDTLATNIILFHNHPSGEPSPSTSDIRETEALRNCLSLFDINLMDHIIISDGGYFSFADEKVNRYTTR